jgi:hypothetical protein
MSSCLPALFASTWIATKLEFLEIKFSLALLQLPSRMETDGQVLLDNRNHLDIFVIYLSDYASLLFIFLETNEQTPEQPELSVPPP